MLPKIMKEKKENTLSCQVIDEYWNELKIEAQEKGITQGLTAKVWAQKIDLNSQLFQIKKLLKAL